MQPPTFVLGTGRCGSTMLSDLVNEHPKVLSLSEFFACLDPLSFADAELGEVDGAAFWSVLSKPRLKHNSLLLKGVKVPEFRYPFDLGRYAPGEVPAISLMTLPPLTDDPDALFDAIRKEVTMTGWPAAPLPQQYLRLFTWWASFLGRDVVIERSGASTRFLPQLVEYFPDARFVHMYRHGPDCAMSMSRHPLFRLSVLIDDLRDELGVNPFMVYDPEHARRLPEELRPFTPDTLDPAVLRDLDIPLERFGAKWSQHVEPIRHLAGLPEERLLHISYDRLVADPLPELTRFGGFVGIPEPAGWARRVSPMIDARRVGAAAALSGPAAEALDRACAPGARQIAKLLSGEGGL